MAAAALGQDRLMSRFGQQLVVFRPAFFGPGFDPAGPLRQLIEGDQAQQFAFQGGLLTDRKAAALQDRRKRL
jgi:hypothetical protein